MGIYETLKHLLGLELEPRDLSTLQVCLRGVIVFAVAIAIVRIGHKRFLSRMTALDAVLGFILSSALARAINGSAPFFPTLLMGLVLVLVHRVLAALGSRFERLGRWIKGNTNVIVENGHPDYALMRRHNISKSDLLEDARLNGNVASLEDIRTATLERSGQISIIKAKDK